MAEDINQINLLARREIEARTAGPLIEQFCEAMGKDKALAEVDKVVQRLAARPEPRWPSPGRQHHGALSQSAGHVETRRRLEIELEEMSKDKLVFKVTRCRYAEMYRDLGYEELGQVLSCGRDAAFARGFNPGIRMTPHQNDHVRGPLLRFQI